MSNTPTPAFKKGARVNVTRGTRDHGQGVVAQVREGKTGAWYDVNFGTKDKPAVKSFRAGNLQPAA